MLGTLVFEISEGWYNIRFWVVCRFWWVFDAVVVLVVSYFGFDCLVCWVDCVLLPFALLFCGFAVLIWVLVCMVSLSDLRVVWFGYRRLVYRFFVDRLW